MKKVLIVTVVAVSGAMVALLTGRAAPAADAGGQQLFVQCAACHSTDGSNGVGPTLKGVVGRASASVPGFAYSNPMKRAHLTWSNDELDKWLVNPQAVVPGNAMPFAGMPDGQQRASLIAYLATLK
jgi:cytochrome c